jgi:hypothetical protein
LSATALGHEIRSVPVTEAQFFYKRRRAFTWINSVGPVVKISNTHVLTTRSVYVPAKVEQPAAGGVQDQVRGHGPLHHLHPVAVPPPHRLARQVPRALLRRALPVLHQQGGGRPGGVVHRPVPRRRPRQAPRLRARAPRRKEGR